MKREQVRTIVLYYASLPAMEKALRQERQELEESYNGLRGASDDPIATGGVPGKPTEMLAVSLAEKGTGKRLAEIEKTLRVWEADAEAIRQAMDAVNGRYKRVIYLRYIRGYSWAKISVQLGVPDSTVRFWTDRALDRIGEAFGETERPAQILQRASRART